MARSDRRSHPATHPHSPEALSERLGRVEVSVENLHEDFSRVGDAVEILSANLNKGRETNWTLVLSAIMLVGAVYAAAIAPIQNDIARQAVDDKQIVANDEKLHEQVVDLTSQLVEAKMRLAALELVNTELRNTTPSMDRRMTLIEMKIGMAK